MKTKSQMWADYPFEGYPNGCRVSQVFYDGDKYCTFLLPNGEQASCKRGYLHVSLKDMRAWYRRLGLVRKFN